MKIPSTASADVFVGQRSYLHRPTQLSSSTHAVIFVGPRSYLHRPTKVSSSKWAYFIGNIVACPIIYA